MASNFQEDEDLKLALKLQAEFDSEQSSSTKMNNDSCEDDHRLALELASQFEAERIAAEQSANEEIQQLLPLEFRTPTKPPKPKELPKENMR